MSNAPTQPAGEGDVPIALDGLRAELEGIAELDLALRPEVLERANASLVAALSQLEEV